MCLPEKRQGGRLAITPTGRVAASLLLFAGVAVRSTGAENQVCGTDAKPANLNLTLKDIHGKTLELSDYKGKVILLDFWATWCPPCRKEIPGFVELYDKYKSRGFVVIGVSIDDSASDVKKFAKQIKMNYPIVMGTGRDDLVQAFGELPLPTSFIIGRDGTICRKHDGLTPKEQYEREIASLF